MANVRARTLPNGPCFDVDRPPSRREYLPKIRVVSADALELFIVSPELVTVVTHFVAGRTVWCTKNPDECSLPHEDVGASRWGAWLAVQVERPGKVYLLRLTEMACKGEPELECKLRSLRGRTVLVKREKGNVQSRMIAYCPPGPADESGLRPAPDLREYLIEMLAAQDRKEPKHYRLKDMVEDAAAARGGKKLFVS